MNDLVAAAENTVAIEDRLTEINSRLAMLDEALAKREDLAACQTRATTRLGAATTGELARSGRCHRDQAHGPRR